MRSIIPLISVTGWFILLIGLVLPLSARSEAEASSAPVIRAKTQHLKEVNVDYILREISLKEVGVIGIELEFHNRSEHKSITLEKRGSGGPMSVIVRQGETKLPRIPQPPYTGKFTPSVNDGRSHMELPPNGRAVFSVSLRDILSKEVVRGRMEDVSIHVKPYVYPIGLPHDYFLHLPILPSAFKGCLITPEGLQVDLGKIQNSGCR